MQHINITVQRLDKTLQMTRGLPNQVGLDHVTHHFVFSVGEIELTVWVAGNLEHGEKDQVIQSILSYLETVRPLPSIN